MSARYTFRRYATEGKTKFYDIWRNDTPSGFVFEHNKEPNEFVLYQAGQEGMKELERWQDGKLVDAKIKARKFVEGLRKNKTKEAN